MPRFRINHTFTTHSYSQMLEASSEEGALIIVAKRLGYGHFPIQGSSLKLGERKVHATRLHEGIPHGHYQSTADVTATL
jgi:hypothetical protein